MNMRVISFVNRCGLVFSSYSELVMASEPESVLYAKQRRLRYAVYYATLEKGLRLMRTSMRVTRCRSMHAFVIDRAQLFCM